jgi:hypothetical protein
LSNDEKTAKSGFNGHCGQNGQNGHRIQKPLLHLCQITATEMNERTGYVFRNDFRFNTKDPWPMRLNRQEAVIDQPACRQADFVGQQVVKLCFSSRYLYSLTIKF